MALCEDDPIGTSKINIDAMMSAAKYFSDRGAFIVFLSTNQVFYGNQSFVPENAPYQPLNEYGRQKSVVEEQIRENCPRSAIVRLTKVVEPNMAMIKNWIERLRLGQPIEAFHDMMLAPVSLRQVLDVLTRVGEAKQNGCYQVSGSEDVSYADVANYLTTCLKTNTNLVHPVSALDKGIKKTFLPRFTTLSCSSTIALCGQKPPHFSEVVQECFDLS
jgi:dTDP-4-dehydrorhamnose reductase